MGRNNFRRSILGALAGILVAAGALLVATQRTPVAVPVPSFAVTVPTAVATFDARGGTLVHEGATLSVPQGALREPTALAMGGTGLPAPLKKGFRPASRVLRLTKATEDRFARPVTITLPVDAKARLDETVALYWDVEHELYRTLTVTRRDERARTVTFETVHFTDFLVTSPDDDDMPDPRAPLANVDTGFTPERDGFFFTNGDYDSSGTCLGMSLLSTWYFETHRNQPDAPRLHDLMAGFHPVANTADLVGREMALAAQRAAIPPGAYLAKPSKDALDEAKRVGPIASGVAMWDALRVTGTPQLIVIQGPRGAHAIVAYAYQDGAFLIYDPNYPLSPKRFPFDRVQGFHDFTGTNLGEPLEVAPVSFSSYAADVDFQKIFDKALEDRGTPERYRSVTIDKAVVKGRDIIIEGHATGGLATTRDPVNRATLYVGPEAVESGHVDHDGTFRIRVPLEKVVAATERNHAAPAIVLGEAWSFAGATSAAGIPGAPSETPGAVNALDGH